jgi:hypothetical protein
MAGGLGHENSLERMGPEGQNADDLGRESCSEWVKYGGKAAGIQIISRCGTAAEGEISYPA